MSVRCITWAFDARVGDHIAKAVLVKLADNANDQGIAWPSVKLISFQTEIPERTVKKKLAWLESQGFIERDHQRAASGAFATTVYRLLKPEAQGAPGGGADRGHEKVSTGGQRGSTRERVPLVGTVIESSGTPSAEISAREARSALWDALVEATGITPEAHGERTRFGMSVKELLDLGATPEEVSRRAVAFTERYPGATLTDRAIVNRWGELNGEAVRGEVRRFGRGVTSRQISEIAKRRAK